MDKEDEIDILILRKWAFDTLDAFVLGIDIRGIPGTTSLVSLASTSSIRVDDVSSRRRFADRVPGSSVTIIGDSEGKDVIGGKGAAIQPIDVGLEVGLAEGTSMAALSSSSVVTQDGVIVG